MTDRIEFYGPKGYGMWSVQSSMVPPVNSHISIKGETYVVKKVTFALDHSDDVALKAMRCNVDLEKP